jgi:hypothetical protein
MISMNYLNQRNGTTLSRAAATARTLTVAMGFGSIVAAALGSATLSAQGAQRMAYDLTAMYEAVNPSIVKVHSDSSTGSGFLIRADGLIATNHHVVRNSRYVAVEFPDGRKVTSDVVLLDAKNDLAILKVNQSVIGDLKPLSLLTPDGDAGVKAGIPVVAFGSPLSQTFLMTQGIVSKVERSVLLGDFLIQPGNSGGPLVNLDGAVIGINTFGEARTSGAVRVNVLRDDLASAALSQGRLTEPSADLLPTASKTRYPTDLLKTKVMGEVLDVRSYRLDGGKFTITALTPVLVAKSNVQDDLKQAANRYSRRGKKIKDESYDPVDEPFYEWVRAATGYLDSVVTFEIKPEYGQTTGSKWASGLAAMSAGVNHTAVPPTRQTYEFKAEFADFKLYRDGKLVTPITPGRAITSQSVDSYLFSFVDEAYSGMYTYAPEVFMTGEEWRLEVFDAREPGRVHRSIILTPASKLIQQVRQDFQGAVK